MTRLPTIKQNLVQYIQAGFPILYINTFEESKADKFISEAADRKEIFEWNSELNFVCYKKSRTDCSS